MKHRKSVVSELTQNECDRGGELDRAFGAVMAPQTSVSSILLMHPLVTKGRILTPVAPPCFGRGTAMTLISLDKLYAVAGLLLTYVAVRAARNRSCHHRLLTVLLWGALAVIYLFGNRLPPVAVGWLMCGLVALAAARQVSTPSEQPVTPAQRAAAVASLGNRVFPPALLIPATAGLGTLVLAKILPGGLHIIDIKQPTLKALRGGCLLTLLVALLITRAAPVAPLNECRRLLHTIGGGYLQCPPPQHRS